MKPLTEQDYRALAERLGLTLIRMAPNTRLPSTWHCPKGHSIFASYNQLQYKLPGNVPCTQCRYVLRATGWGYSKPATAAAAPKPVAAAPKPIVIVAPLSTKITDLEFDGLSVAKLSAMLYRFKDPMDNKTPPIKTLKDLQQYSKEYLMGKVGLTKEMANAVAETAKSCGRPLPKS